MKFLIYYVCFGDYYQKMMTICSIFSLRKYTDYSGDIVVLTDDGGLPEIYKSMCGDVTVINIFEKDRDYRDVVRDRFGIYCMKSIAYQIIDFKKYDFILYLDSDILINYKNLNALMGFWAACNNIQCSDNEGWTVGRNVKSTGSEILTDEEKKKWAHHGFCAGIVGFPGGQFGIDFCETWWTLNKEHNFRLDDQGNLTAVLLRNYPNKYEFIRFMNKNRTRLDGITHYHSGHKPSFWNHVRYMLLDHQINVDISGEWSMKKMSEGLENHWRISQNVVVVDDPMLIGILQPTEFGIFLWWNSLNGFERLPVLMEKKIYGDSFRGGEKAFTLERLNTY